MNSSVISHRIRHSYHLINHNSLISYYSPIIEYVPTPISWKKSTTVASVRLFHERARRHAIAPSPGGVRHSLVIGFHAPTTLSLTQLHAFTQRYTIIRSTHQLSYFVYLTLTFYPRIGSLWLPPSSPPPSLVLCSPVFNSYVHD